MSARRNGSAAMAASALLLASVVARPTPAVAAAGRWTSAGPDGGSPAAVAVAPSRPRVMYASGGDGSVFGSVDGGATWRQVGRTGLPEVTTLAIDPGAPGVVFAASESAAGGSAIDKSTDGGRTWRAVGSSTGVYGSIVFDPADPAFVYATDGRRVDASDDGGDTWTPGSYQFFNEVTALGIDPVDGHALFAATQGEIRRSVDGGHTWTLVYSLPFDTFGRAFGASPADPSTIFAGYDAGIVRSTDGGITWASADEGLPPGTGVYALAVDPLDAARVYAANRFAGIHTGAAVYTTTDGGAGWRAASSGLPEAEPLAMAIDPAHPRLISVSISDRGLYTTADGGATWAQTGKGLVITTVAALLAGMNSPGAVLAGTDHGLYRSTDDGRHWAPVSGGLAPEAVSAVVSSDRRGTALFAGTTHGVYLSTDGGQTWTPTAMAADTYGLVAGGAGASLTLYASGRGGYEGRIYKSADRGRSWFSVFEASGAVAAGPEDPNVAFVGGEGLGIRRTLDGGVTWTEVTGVPAAAIVVDPADSSVVFAGVVCGVGSECAEQSGPYGVWKSTDGGATWSGADQGLPEFATVLSVAVDRFDPQVVYAGTEGFGVYRSSDGGATWTAFGGGLDDATVPALAVAPSGRVVHAGTVETGAFDYGFVG